MRDAYRITALGAVLALWLILGFWPLSTGSRVALSLLVVLVSGVMLWRQRRASQARATAVREIVDENLPPEDFQGAVILVRGDNAPLFVSGSRHRETRQGWYLWVKDAEQLPLLAQHLSLVRSALVSQTSVMLGGGALNSTPPAMILPSPCGAGSVLSSSAVRHLALSPRCGP